MNDKEEIINSTMKIISSVIKKNTSFNTDEERLLNKKTKLENQINKAIRLCINEVITEQELKNQKQDLEKELNFVNQDLIKTKERQELLNNKEELLSNIEKNLNEILDFKITSDNVCKEVLEKVVVKSKNEFDFYIKGFNTPFFKNYKGVILDTMLEQKN